MQDEITLEEARRAMSEKDWTRGAEIYSRLIEGEGDGAPAEAYDGLARAYRLSGLTDAAERTAAEGLKRFPDNANIVREMAELHMGRREWDKAAPQWDRALSLMAKRAPWSVYAKLARARRQTGEVDAAESAIERGMAHHADNPALRREHAENAMARGAWPEAVRRWADAAAADGDKTPPGTFARWAVSHREQAQFDAAEEVIGQGLALHPGNGQLANEADDLKIARRRHAFHLDHPSAEAEAAGRPMSIERICQCFWDTEDRLGLREWDVHGVHPWPLMRMQLYYSITQRVGLFDPPHPAVKWRVEKSAEEKARQFDLEAFWVALEKLHAEGRDASELTGAAATMVRPKPYAIIMATRKLNGSETYSEALRAEIANQSILFDRPLEGGALDGALDFAELVELFRQRYREPDHARFPHEAREKCEDIREAFFVSLGLDLGDLARICHRRVVDYLPIHKGFDIFFSMYPVKTLFLTNAYGTSTGAALSAARKNGAHIVELQHGFISPYHLGYSWPGHPKVPYKPDELWCFGGFWPESTPLAAGMEPRVIGAPYVKALAAQHRTDHDERLVVFTSQGVIGKRLFEVALEFARRRPDYRTIFRLHPSEALEDYEAMRDAAGTVPGNFSISHRTPNIFALLAGAGIQVGAFSTTLFEGMALGTKTVVIEMPGSEYMRPAIERGDVLFVRDVEELIAKIDAAPLAADPDYYYAEPAKPLV